MVADEPQLDLRRCGHLSRLACAIPRTQGRTPASHKFRAAPRPPLRIHENSPLQSGIHTRRANAPNFQLTQFFATRSRGERITTKDFTGPQRSHRKSMNFKVYVHRMRLNLRKSDNHNKTGANAPTSQFPFPGSLQRAGTGTGKCMQPAAISRAGERQGRSQSITFSGSALRSILPSRPLDLDAVAHSGGQDRPGSGPPKAWS